MADQSPQETEKDRTWSDLQMGWWRRFLNFWTCCGWLAERHDPNACNCNCHDDDWRYC